MTPAPWWRPRNAPRGELVFSPAAVRSHRRDYLVAGERAFGDEDQQWVNGHLGLQVKTSLGDVHRLNLQRLTLLPLIAVVASRDEVVRRVGAAHAVGDNVVNFEDDVGSLTPTVLTGEVVPLEDLPTRLTKVTSAHEEAAFPSTAGSYTAVPVRAAHLSLSRLTRAPSTFDNIWGQGEARFGTSRTDYFAYDALKEVYLWVLSQLSSPSYAASS